MTRVWTVFILQHVALLLVGAGIGALYDSTLAGILLAALAMLVWHGVLLYRLERWLSTGEQPEMPWGSGIWARVFSQVDYARERARTSRRNWRALIKELRKSAKAFPDGGVVLNDAHEIINYNKAARRLLGLKKRRDRGQRIENLIRHPDFISYLQNPKQKRSLEIPSPGNPEIWLSFRIIPYGPGQKLLLARDVTQAVRMEEMRRDFVANASHELRTPLTVITGYLEGLDDEPRLPGNWKQPLRDMRDQAARMNALVGDLLQLSRLESFDSSSTDTVVDVPQLLTAARADALAEVEAPARIELCINASDNLYGEEREIRSIVANLVSNALRFTPSEGLITITWDCDERGARLSVADTGIGVPEEDLPRLTERFYRADSGRGRENGGTGLGLAIVKHAIKRHDGELEISSKLGKGSRFICHFPPSRIAPATVHAGRLNDRSA